MNRIDFLLFTLLSFINICYVNNSLSITCGSGYEDCEQEEITCNENEDCKIYCIDSNSCKNTIIYGNNANNLYVDISASYGAQELSVYCDILSNGNCEIICEEDNACRNINVYGNTNTQIKELKIIGGDPDCCEGDYDSSIRYGIINCGLTKKCTILCNDIDSCEDTLIYGDNALDLTVIGSSLNSLRDSVIDCGYGTDNDESLCNIECLGDMSCYFTNIYCNSIKECNIECDVSDSCHRNNIYGNNTLSLDIKGKESNSIDGIYIDCGINNENECILDCDDDNSCLHIDVKTGLSKKFEFNYGDASRGKSIVLDTSLSPVYDCTNSVGDSDVLTTSTVSTTRNTYDDDNDTIGNGGIECINVESELNEGISFVKCPNNDNYVLTECGAITTNNSIFSTYIDNEETCLAGSPGMVKASARCCKIVNY